jgi:hypothetical protein
MSDPQVPLLSRTAGADPDRVEVRIFLPRGLAAVLDTLSVQDPSTNRTALVTAATKEYLEKRLYDARMLVRMHDSANPTSPERSDAHR